MFSRSFARYQEVMGQFGCKQKILRCNDVMVVYFFGRVTLRCMRNITVFYKIILSPNT